MKSEEARFTNKIMPPEFKKEKWDSKEENRD
jgi:hypothetical protein